MNAKYADVIGVAKVIDYITQLPSGLFDLPQGVAADVMRAAE